MLILGPDSCKDVAMEYGFSRAVLADEVLHHDQTIWPFRKTLSKHLKPLDLTQHRIEAIMMYHDSQDWGRDLQISLDVLRSDGGSVGTLHSQPDASSQIPIYFSNPDLLWSNEFPVPRFAQGAFRMSMMHIYEVRKWRDQVIYFIL